MPEICRFLGIIITMYFNEHNPPHFHARYGDHRAEIALKPSPSLREGCRLGFWGWSWNGRPSTARS